MNQINNIVDTRKVVLTLLLESFRSHCKQNPDPILLQDKQSLTSSAYISTRE